MNADGEPGSIGCVAGLPEEGDAMVKSGFPGRGLGRRPRSPARSECDAGGLPGRIRFPILCTVALLVCVPAGLYAEDDESALSELSLQDLMNIKVVAASRWEETLREAPGIVSVMTRDEIRSFAGLTLGDVLQRAPGAQLLTANVFPDNVVAFRGQNLTPYNNHVLFLLDGRPIRDPVAGGINHVLLTSFPVDHIERLEIIRGPGSVLYGSLAYSAVINIVTRTTADEAPEFEASLGVGTWGTQRSTLHAGLGFAEGSLEIAAQSLSCDGPTYEFTDVQGTAGRDRFSRDTFGAFAGLRHGGLSLNLFAGEFEYYGLEAAELTWAPGTYWENTRHTRLFGNLGYQRDLSPMANLAGNLTFNRHELGAIEGIQTADEWMGEVTLHLNPGPRFNLIGGATFTRERYGGTLLIDHSLESYSLYLEASSWLTDAVKLIAGAQWNKLENIDGQVSPRVGLVTKLPAGFGLKVLYSEAFRKAYPLETSFDHPLFRGNLEVKPEIIKTSELELSYQTSDLRLSLAAYHSSMSEIIGRRWVEDDDPANEHGGFLVYTNFGTHTFNGVELEVTAHLGRSWQLVGSATYQENEDGNGLDNAALHPNELVKFGAIYTQRALTLGVFDAYYGSPTPVAHRNPEVEISNPEASAYHLLSARLRLEIGRLFGVDPAHGLWLSAEASNLFDEDVRYPEYTSRQVNTLIPLAGGRAFFAKIAMEF